MSIVWQACYLLMWVEVLLCALVWLPFRSWRKFLLQRYVFSAHLRRAASLRGAAALCLCVCVCVFVCGGGLKGRG